MPVASATPGGRWRRAPGPPPPADCYRILFLSSTPLDAAQIRVQHEFQIVREALKNREHMHLECVLDLPLDALSDCLLAYQPHVLHFAGHGQASRLTGDDGALATGLIFTDSRGRRCVVPADTLGQLLGLPSIQRYLKLVVLNACWSEAQAATLVDQAGICVAVGVPHTITDSEATRFSQGFYQGLGYQLPFSEMLGTGVFQMKLFGDAVDGSTPAHMRWRADIDPQRHRLVDLVPAMG